MILVIIRTLILYTTVVIVLRIMGKRQIGQLQPYELVVIIMISELAAIPMQNTGVPILNGLVPIFVLFAAEVTLSYIALKSEKARGVICGKPSILIANARINEEEMRRLRFNINELLEELRLKDVTDISDVEYAILETGGQLSVILKSQKRPVEPADLGIATPYEGLSTTVVIDGVVIPENLKKVFLSIDWLKAELSKDGVRRLSDVFFASVNPQGELFYQLKQS
ncbi:MAG: DUF421 domain-containing protein [Syntrophomonadaceae bacterium]|mgnify:CR=1 FL=1|nr:DUF421 domain-containing protein [Syntrophomonadaceae bacterium]